MNIEQTAEDLVRFLIERGILNPKTDEEKKEAEDTVEEFLADIGLHQVLI